MASVCDGNNNGGCKYDVGDCFKTNIATIDPQQSSPSYSHPPMLFPSSQKQSSLKLWGFFFTFLA